MPDKNRPLSKKHAPDPATCYERAKPEMEAGMGRLDNNKGTPETSPDHIDHAFPNRQISEHQLNGEEVIDHRARQNLSDVPGVGLPVDDKPRTHRHVK